MDGTVPLTDAIRHHKCSTTCSSPQLSLNWSCFNTIATPPATAPGLIFAPFTNRESYNIRSRGPSPTSRPPSIPSPFMSASVDMLFNNATNNGRSVTYSMRRPVDIDHLFRDPDTLLPVMLTATRITPQSPRDSHWKLAWKVGKSSSGIPVQREIYIVRNMTIHDYMNWGPITKTAEECTRTVEITKMTLANRKRLENVAADVPFQRHTGKTHCQDWIIAVLEAAERQGLLTRSDWTAAVRAVADV